MPATSSQARFSIDEPDNSRLASLCGALDAHLRLIEPALEVRITRRGATFLVEGGQAERGARLLARLYHGGKHPLSPEDIQLAIIESRHDEPAEQPVTKLPPISAPSARPALCQLSED